MTETRWQILFPLIVAAAFVMACAAAVRGATITATTLNQALIDNAANGDTIDFPAGANREITIPGKLRLTKQLNLRGYGNTTIKTSGFYLFDAPQAHGLTLTGLRFVGPVLCVLDPVAGANEYRDLKVRNCRFSVPGQPGAPRMEQWSAFAGNKALVNAEFSNCVIENVDSWCFIIWYYWRNLSFIDCEFYRLGNNNHPDFQGRFLKLIGGGGIEGEGANNRAAYASTIYGLVVRRVLFSDYGGMCIEYQGGANDSIFEDIVCDKPRFSSNQQANLDRYGLSLAQGRGVGMRVRRCLVRSADARLRQAIELAGFDTICEDCYIEGQAGVPRGLNESICFDGTNGTGAVRNNRLVNCPPVALANNAHPTLSNNGPGVVLSWDINRPFPSDSGTVTPPPPPPPILPESPNGTIVPPATQIVDASRTVWTITPGKQIARNGVTMNTADVKELRYIDGVVYQRASILDWWWKWSGAGWVVTTEPGVIVPPPPPPDIAALQAQLAAALASGAAKDAEIAALKAKIAAARAALN